MRHLIIFIIIGTYGLTHAQEVSVHPSLFGVQLGLASVSAHAELKLSPTSTLRAELAMALGALNYDNDIEFFFIPLIAAESRRYYNLVKRHSVGKNIYKNSANFYSLFLYYQPRKYSARGNRRIRFSEATSIYARWGLRRTYGKHFTMETAVGPGLVLYNLSAEVQRAFDINIDFRIGYTF